MRRISKIALPGLYMFAGTLSLLFFPLAETVVQCAVLACLFGISFGGVASTISIASLHLLGEKDYSIGLGMVLTLAGISSTVTGPVAGTSPLVFLNICSYFCGNIFFTFRNAKIYYFNVRISIHALYRPSRIE